MEMIFERNYPHDRILPDERHGEGIHHLTFEVANSKEKIAHLRQGVNIVGARREYRQ
jgi:4-hydroxyphenylpyruvate dioxygenase-like putative hemolysin